MRLSSLLLTGLIGLAGLLSTAFAADRPLTVFAAASLKESLDGVERAWEASGHPKFVVSYAASSALARQIEAGAPADVFISADNRWMDYLQDRKLIEPASRFVLVRNELVLIAPANSPLKSITLDSKQAWLAALGTGRLAVAEVASVPAGTYARQALEKLGLWDALAAHLAQGENVRATLEFVARGDTPLGIVYLTDAKVEPRVKVLAAFPAASHDPIVYPAARTVGAGDAKSAAELLAFLRGRQAVAIFRAAGFADKR
ncbi:MAG: molybdate ABC transporter substrate-binding protein [Proteobacteria bacterium]|nr:molybdate ABC transporter substrate-binding protein [Pseudomonadota bacterium]MBS0465546.1 molybdate ABC transporter substrate-binding protein [Pseudomonadota bacterium]